MSPYEDAITKIKAVLGPDMHEGVDAAITVCEDLILHAQQNCMKRPVYLTNFYRGLIAASGAFEQFAMCAFSAVASAVLLKLQESGQLDELSLARHSYALQQANREMTATNKAEYHKAHEPSAISHLVIDGPTNNESIDSIISRLFREKAKPGDN